MIASKAPASLKVKARQKPKQIFCIEPHIELYKILVKNVAHTNAVCINKAIGSIDG